MSNEKEYTEGISVKSKMLSKLDNFWYHYKWPTIAVVFFLIVGLVCGLQTCTMEKHDLVLIYSGRNALSASQAEEICRVLEGICPEDFDGDGAKNLALSKYHVLSKEQIEDMRKQKDPNGDPVFVDTNFFTTQYQTYSSYIMTGESSVAFLEPWLYEALVEAGRLEKIAGLVGSPAGAVGEYGVKLGDTQLYKTYGVMRALPSDTVICLLSPLWKGGKSSKPEYYEREKEMFTAIVTFASEDN